jgi:hypothetical protein
LEAGLSTSLPSASRLSLSIPSASISITVAPKLHERSSKLSLSQFYQKYHKFLYLMYRDAMYWWGKKGEEFPDLKEITEFTVMLENEKT